MVCALGLAGEVRVVGNSTDVLIGDAKSCFCVWVYDGSEGTGKA
jgi:hypothetical protein